MEATGGFWRPVWAALEGQFALMLVNPHHIQVIPGRKSDAKDCAWIADLLQHGLIRGSFVPPTDIQDLRNVTRSDQWWPFTDHMLRLLCSEVVLHRRVPGGSDRSAFAYNSRKKSGDSGWARRNPAGTST